MALGIRSPYTPYSIYLRGTKGLRVYGSEVGPAYIYIYTYLYLSIYLYMVTTVTRMATPRGLIPVTVGTFEAYHGGGIPLAGGEGGAGSAKLRNIYIYIHMV